MMSLFRNLKIHRASNLFMGNGIGQVNRGISSLVKAEPTIYVNKKNSFQDQHRHIYCRTTIGLEKADLGLEAFEHYRVQPKSEIKRECLETIDFEKFNSDDIRRLKHLIFLANDDPTCLDAVDRYLAKNHELLGQSEGMKIPLSIIRHCFKTNDSERALKYIKPDSGFGKLFQTNECYRIALTCLYNAERYKDLSEIFKILEKNDPTLCSLPGLRERCRVVAVASLARINTPEALEDAKKLINDLEKVAYSDAVRRFVLHLALNQNDFDLANQLMSSMETRVNNDHFRIRMLMKQSNPEGLVQFLQQLLEGSRSRIPSDIVGQLKHYAQGLSDEDMKGKISSLVDRYEKEGRVLNLTSDQLVFRSIGRGPKDQNNRLGETSPRGPSTNIGRQSDNQMRQRRGFGRTFSSDSRKFASYM